MLNLAAKKTGARLTECLSVGDRYDIDLSLALEMGMGAVLVSGVEDVYELPDLI
ncbi:HAD hydrolase-like protein [Treponema sp.]|uniref:HAD hydrolase-like protein n=1 Tax=Treponema sp. TaxID=166 RepID=UPI00298DF0B2|nr:HAD hydrolase-like protein [Treponema sp.]